MTRPLAKPSWVAHLLLLGCLNAGTFVLAGGCSHNPRRPAAGWRAHDTRNVRVYSSTLVEHEYPQEWLENAYHAYQHSFFAGKTLHPIEAMFLQVPPGAGTRIYRPNDDPPASYALEGMPGGGRIGRDGLIVLTERLDWKGATRQVAYQMIGQVIKDPPLWFRIGFGQYLSEFRIHYNKARWQVCYGASHGLLSPGYYASAGGLGLRPQTVHDVPGRDVLVPLSEVLGATWDDYAKHGRYWFNYTAYAFVSYLIHGREGAHIPRFRILVDALARGLGSADALALAYPHLLPDELDDELVKYVRSPRRPSQWQEKPDGVCFPIPPGSHASKKAAASPVDEATVQAALDDLERMPVWRGSVSWYPTDVLVATSGVLHPTVGGGEKSQREGRERKGGDDPAVAPPSSPQMLREGRSP